MRGGAARGGGAGALRGQVHCGVERVAGEGRCRRCVIVCVVVVVVGTVVVVRLYVGGSMQGANERPLLARTALGQN